MAHNIEIRNGVASFVFNERGGMPWHGLGQAHEGPMTLQEALMLGRADFRVGLAEISHGGRVVEELPDRLTLRLDTRKALAVVGGDYTVMDYVDVAHSVLDPAFGAGSECVDTLGVLGRGERFFATAQLNGETEIRPGDSLRHYLTVTSSHDGSSSVVAFEGTVRVVCQNTLTLALEEAQHKYSLRHTASVDARVKEVGKILGSFARYREEQAKQFRELAKRSCPTSRARDVVAQVFPVSKVVEDGQEVDSERSRTIQEKARNRVLALFEGEADRQDLNTHSDWDLLQAVTQYVDRDRPARSSDNRLNKWLDSTFNATAQETRQNAYLALVRS